MAQAAAAREPWSIIPFSLAAGAAGIPALMDKPFPVGITTDDRVRRDDVYATR